MRLKLASILLMSALASGAEAVALDNRVPSDVDLRVVTAHDARPGNGPVGVTDRFFLEGQVVRLVNLDWSESHVAIDEQASGPRGHCGDRRVRKATAAFTVEKAPLMFRSDVGPASLGLDPCAT